MLRIADLGATFGISGGSVFRSPWHDFATVVVPRSYGDFVDQSDEIDLVIFGGGGDIHPSLYGHNDVGSHVGSTPSARDVNELASYRVCLKKEIPVFGICRGAQLACIMADGFLVQNVTNHAGSNHMIQDIRDDKEYEITTAHHQMMGLEGTKHELIAKMPKPISRGYLYDKGGKNKYSVIDMEPEIVFFPEIRSLAVQGHPEFMSSSHPTVVYVRGLVNKYLLKGKAKNV